MREDAAEVATEIKEAAASEGPILPVEIALRRPRFWSSTFTSTFLLSTMSLFGLAAMLGFDGAQSDPDWPATLSSAWPPLVGAVLLLGLRGLLRPKAVPPIAFFDEHMTLPKTAGSKQSLRLGYDEILSIDLRGRGGAERLCIATRQHLLMYSRLAFREPDAVERALRELYVRILRLPQGNRIVERIAERRRLAIATLLSPASATHALLGAQIAIFALTFLGGALTTPLGLVPYGSNAGALVRAGEVHRLISGTYLHGSVLHLYFNGLSLFFLGAMLERLLGRSRFLIIYFVSALAASLASAFGSGALHSVGASGGILGLFGGLLWVNVRFKSDLPVGFRQPLRWWIVIIALQAMLPLFIPSIDVFAHLGGFVAGLLVTYLVIGPHETLDPTQSSRPSLRVVALLLAIINGVALAYALQVGRARGRDSVAELVRLETQASNSSPSRLNEVAWYVAIDASASARELRLAEEAAQQALLLRHGEGEIVDTLATLRYRQGDLAGAVELQRALLDQDGSVYAFHLAQFLRGAPAPEGVQARPLGKGVEVRLPASVDGLEVYLLTSRSERPLRLFRVRARGEAATAFLATTEEVRVAYVAAGCPSCAAAQAPEVRDWSFGNLVPDLP